MMMLNTIRMSISLCFLSVFSVLVMAENTCSSIKETCKPISECPKYQDDGQRLSSLPLKSLERKALQESLEARICSREEKTVCCLDDETSTERLAVNIDIEEIPEAKYCRPDSPCGYGESQCRADEDCA